MNFSIQKKESHTSIRILHEKLDTRIAPGLKSELLILIKNGESNILIDLSGCDSCDSSGISSLLLGNRLCKEVNGKFVLFGCYGQVKEMLELAGIGDTMLLVDTKDQANHCFLFNQNS